MNVGSWVTAAVSIAVVVLLIGAVAGAVLGVALASYGRIPLRVAVPVAVVPILGPAGLAVAALVRSWRSRGARDLRSPLLVALRRGPISGPNAFRIGSLVFGVLLLLSLLVLPLVQLRGLRGLLVPVYAGSLPGGMLAIVGTVLLLAIVAVLTFRAASRVGAVVTSTLGGVWAAASLAVLLIAGPMTSLLATLGGWAGSLAGAIAVRVLSSADRSAGGAVAVLRESLSARLGPAAWAGLAAGLVLLAWSVAEVIVAYRAEVARAGRATASEATSVRPAPAPAHASTEEFTW